MIHRTARERLLFEARDVAEDVETLEGIRGHTATLERSETGPARIVRVWHHGELVTWSFSLDSGEARPHFYPPDVPFIPDLRCEVTWDDESGLVVKWSEQLDAQREEKVRESLESFIGRVEELRGRPLEPGAGISAEEAREALSAMAIPGQDGVVVSRLREIVSFHEAGGWSLVSDARSGPVEKVRLSRGDRERSLVTTTFGASIIVLGEGGPDSQEPHPVESSKAHPGLRLRWKDG